jgi:hypothetical protein
MFVCPPELSSDFDDIVQLGSRRISLLRMSGMAARSGRQFAEILLESLLSARDQLLIAVRV